MGNAQSRREAREARRKKNFRKWIALSGAGVVLLSGGLLALNLSAAEQKTTPQSIPSNCLTTQRVTVQTTPEMAEVLKKIPVTADNCITLSVNSETNAIDTAAEIMSGKSAPNLWIPDSSTRAELSLAGKAKVITHAKSLAKSPAVIVTESDKKYETWNAALEDSTHLDMSEPKVDSGAFLALLDATAETNNKTVSAEQLTANAGLRAQTIGVDEPGSTAGELLDQVQNKKTESAIVTESDYYRYMAAHNDSSIKAYVPQNKTQSLDYPMYQPSDSTDTNKTIDAAATKIEDYLKSEDGKKALEAQGIRASDNQSLDKNTVGDVADLPDAQPQSISNMWNSYLRQSAPTNALVAIDASGSMAYKLGDTNRTRMDITKEAVLAGSRLFPERDSLGLWSFARNIASDDHGKKTDYKKLVPIRQISDEVDGKSQREILVDAGSQIQPYKDAQTGLNDTTWAAFQEVKKNYQNDSANVVVIMTDGENSDNDSISTEDLVKKIQQNQDKDHPVFMIYIGISEDANMENLQYLAEQTGGEAHPANSAADIQGIFQKALTVSPEESDTAATATPAP